jgi:hypothetical protein
VKRFGLGLLMLCWLGLQGLATVHASVHAFHGHEEGHQGISCQVFVAADRANHALDVDALDTFQPLFLAHSPASNLAPSAGFSLAFAAYSAQGPPA